MSRARFEAWHVLKYPGATLARRANGEYMNLYVEMCWTGWEARREAVVVTLPSILDHKYERGSYGQGYNVRLFSADLRAAIEAAGVKVAP